MVKQERAARTRHALIQAAAAVFAEDGFTTASLSTISRRAGVSNGALHFHFASKHALAQAVTAEAARTVRRITDRAQEDRAHSLQCVVDATHDLMSRLADDIVLRAGFELAALPAQRRESSLRTQWQHWVEDSFRRAEHSGSLARGVSWADGARVVVAATAGFEVLGAGDVSWLSRTSVTRLWEVLLPRLAGPAGQANLVCAGTRHPPGLPAHQPPAHEHPSRELPAQEPPVQELPARGSAAQEPRVQEPPAQEPPVRTRPGQ
ncbi:ScbR family autoregulator-binding transcription factor [Streptomyces asoensis]|uniref:ScbR family autoregulator-binding transcription factor n=1 Tax=Streptomyces asoensis TaxID=249586 RepID=UPI00340FCCD9